MNLAHRCAPEFEDQDWHRGLEYYSAGNVIISSRSRTRIEADVHGSSGKEYFVVLDWSDASRGDLYASCTCPRFEDGWNCKHIAAAIRAVDAIGLGKSVPGRSNLQLIPDGEDLDAPDISRLPPELKSQIDLSSIASAREILGDFFGALGKAKNLPAPRKPPSPPKPPAVPEWKKRLNDLTRYHSASFSRHLRTAVDVSEKERQIFFSLNLDETARTRTPHVEFHQRLVKKDGKLGRLTPARVERGYIHEAPTAEERQLFSALLGVNPQGTYSSYYSSEYEDFREYTRVMLDPVAAPLILPQLCATGRFGLLYKNAKKDEQIRPLAWDDGAPWQFQLRIEKTTDGREFVVTGHLTRGETLRPLCDANVLLDDGLVVFPDSIARFDLQGAAGWPAYLRQFGEIRVPFSGAQELRHQLSTTPRSVCPHLPPELEFQERVAAPTAHLTIKEVPANAYSQELPCVLTFHYGKWEVAPEELYTGQWNDQAREIIRRDFEFEHKAAQLLCRSGVRAEHPPSYAKERRVKWFIAPKKMPALVATLAAAGWSVEAEGKLVRRPGELKVSISSGVDWFDLEASCDFDGVQVGLPQLLEALRRGQRMVTLDDGSQGMLPEEWLRKFAPLAELGTAGEDKLRFKPSQATLLDALLAAQESGAVSFDETFGKLRERLHSFAGVAPVPAPSSFQGELRPYQREGVGWLHFLRDFNFGGCLADDMGLGKTIQVLALLEQRRLERLQSGKGSPSLVVAPKSLVFNWAEEAKRFTPEMRVLNYTGLERGAAREHLEDYDLILTTYGTLRRDVAVLRDFKFDYAILDEAQAIKNSASQSYKACRLLQSDHRLAMTGTPIENHLGELWSLLDYLNPGMLGACGKLNDLFVNGRGGTPDAQREDKSAAVQSLGRALRPFMLRRTKQQVLKDLPEKTEQTLHCELDAKERKAYNDLRDHYRKSLTATIQKSGLKQSKIHVLEALLRLRQAACHPGLLDQKKAKQSSSKLETLLEQLDELLSEGHKALVFSQFTSLLAIVKTQLDKRGVTYEYLDGKTTDRQARVERFQTDEKCPLFLISLKAGGQGLNLTAADYVFILDPWWNPAVEAQAVDRAHRMGQQRPVTAYRIIAKDTVEEKILQLQAQKRDLADAIVSAENSALANLTAEDLQLLLS